MMAQHDRDSFEALFHRLVSSWQHHEELRGNNPSISDLAHSSQQLFDIRVDMGVWLAAREWKS